ncbi:hypothetical protein HUJ05_005220 [Dendroctonus ponderosae]|nr:hypothetical protein HUJ05_005220 [Dendroctonus ponderosae]
MFPMWLPFPESEFKSSAVVIKCLLVSACTFMYIVFCMIFLALMIYCVWLLKMQQAKIHKCNWDSYDMAANPSADMTALIINNLRVFGFIEHVDKSVRYAILVDVLLNSINIASLATYGSTKHVRKTKKTYTTDTIDDNGIERYTHKEKADAFAGHYQKAFSISTNPNFDNDNWNMINDWYLNYFNNSPNYTYKTNHRQNTAPRKDKTAEKLNPRNSQLILTEINNCIRNNKILKTWKSGVIINIPKNGRDGTQLENYRPITLLPALCKVLEHILKQRLEELIGKHIPIYQFGFKQYHSTIQTTHLTDGKPACLLMDINRAFDSVWYRGLLYKLHTPPYLLHTIKNLSENRQQQVRIDNTLSITFSPEQRTPARKDPRSHPFSTVHTAMTYTITTYQTKIKSTERHTYYNTLTTRHLLYTTKLLKKRLKESKH